MYFYAKYPQKVYLIVSFRVFLMIGQHWFRCDAVKQQALIKPLLIKVIDSL